MMERTKATWNRNMSKTWKKSSQSETAGDRVFTVRQAAVYCMVSSETIRRWIKSGELTAFNNKGKGVMKLRRKDLDEFAGRNNMLVNQEAVDQ
jgi:excisionase family DNA binding protein